MISSDQYSKCFVCGKTIEKTSASVSWSFVVTTWNNIVFGFEYLVCIKHSREEEYRRGSVLSSTLMGTSVEEIIG